MNQAVNNDPMIGRVIADRYRLEARAGEGGIGAVYRARHLLIDRIVAIKILQPLRRGEAHHRDWFVREARAANRVNHANIVDIYDFGDDRDGLYYLVMEYLHGSPLSHVISRGPMPVGRAVDLMEQICAALTRAHDLGVVHRDIKSDNVFLTERGGRQDYVKVFDFGLASLKHDRRLAPEGAVFGTPEYMSPEQTRGEDATPASDLYALGVLFFEMVTGRLPFVHQDRQKLLEMHRSVEPDDPKIFEPDIPDATAEVILKLLKKEPSDRFRDAHHLHEEIKKMQRAAPRALSWSPVKSETGKPKGPKKNRVAVTSGVAAWALRSVMFGRMVAVAKIDDRAQPLVRRSLADMWMFCTSAARVESDIAAEASRVQHYESRSRDLRAQLGRQIAELATEESRLIRSSADAEAKAELIRKDAQQARERLDGQWAEISQLEAAGEQQALRKAYESAGAARVRFSQRSQELTKVEDEISNMKTTARNMGRRIIELRDSLDRQADRLDVSLADARRKMAASGRNRAQVLHDLEDSALTLLNELENRPELTPLFGEMEALVGPLSRIPGRPSTFELEEIGNNPEHNTVLTNPPAKS
jgi:eukaryotic-like serine/threonine-protein kinase